jgi:hypothetical protein
MATKTQTHDDGRTSFSVRLDADLHISLSKKAASVGLRFTDYARIILKREDVKEIILRRLQKAV